MTDEELFDSVTRHCPGFGPRLDLNELHPLARWIFDRETTRANSFIATAHQALPEMPRIHFDWVNSGHLNALAFKEHGKYFIGVTSGALYIIHLLFNLMLADSRFLRDIGNPDEETTQDPILDWSENWTPTAHELYEFGVQIANPKNAYRQLYAAHLEQELMSFLIAHELTHITNGHIAYGNAQMGYTALQERGWVKGEDEPPLTSQTCEMDADSGAVCDSIGSIKIKFTDPERAPTELWKPYYENPESACFTWAVAVSMFFRLFGDGRFEGESLMDMVYPPFRIRQQMALGTATTYIMERWDNGLTESCSQAMVNGMMEVERAFPLMTNTPYSVQGIRESAGPIGLAHSNLLIEHWKTVLRSELSPHAHVGLPV